MVKWNHSYFKYALDRFHSDFQILNVLAARVQYSTYRTLDIHQFCKLKSGCFTRESVVKRIQIFTDLSMLLAVYFRHVYKFKTYTCGLYRFILPSSTIIEYIFNSFLFCKSSLNKKLLNIYLIEVHERDIRPSNCKENFL